MKCPRLMLSLTLGLAATPPAFAEPVVDFTFDGDDALSSVVGGLKMNLRQKAEIVSLPTEEGLGAHFGDAQALRVTAGDGNLGVLPNLPPLGGSFTIEALVNLPDRPPRLGYMMAMVGDLGSPRQYSFLFMVRGDGKLETQPRELVLVISDGERFFQANSGLIMEAGVDYYVAAAADIEGGAITFKRQRLDGDHEAEVVVKAHPLKSLHDARVLQVGDSLNNIDVSFGGLIDNLRISRGALKADELGWPRKAE